MSRPAEAAPARERGRTIHAASTYRVEVVPGRVYVADIWDSFTLAVMAAVLEAAWAEPDWRQPWGLVLVLDGTASYDPDLRRHAMPPDPKRSVGTAIVSESLMHQIKLNCSYRGANALTVVLNEF
jgi:hypothetical protein